MVNLKDMEGTWYVNRSSFSLWLKGDKSNPVFHYELVVCQDEKTGLIYRLSYQKDGRLHSMNGFDELDDAERKEFTWRGEGLTRFFKNKWEVIYIDENKDWAIIHFKKTFFTPEGYDIVSRYKNLNARMRTVISQAQKRLQLEALLTPIYQV